MTLICIYLCNPSAGRAGLLHLWQTGLQKTGPWQPRIRYSGEEFF